MDDKSQFIQGTVYLYKYLNHGAQYRVYAIHTMDGNATGRVIKVPLDFDESRRALAPHLRKLAFSELEIDQRIHTLILRKQQVPQLLQGVFARDKALMRMLGDLQLVPKLIHVPPASPKYTMPVYFTQKQVTATADFMHTFRFVHSASSKLDIADVRQAKLLLHAIINLHYRLWEFGIFELTFKLENVGITYGKSIGAVLVDVAEHTLDAGLAKATLAEQKWHYWCDPIKTDHLFLPTILHETYMKVCDEMLTPEAFDRHWRKRSTAIIQRATWALRAQELLSHGGDKGLSLWVKRQALQTELYRGIPTERVDPMMIPRSDLELLYRDAHANSAPRNAIELQAEAERAMMQQNTDGLEQELLRHMLPVSSS